MLLSEIEEQQFQQTVEWCSARIPVICLPVGGEWLIHKADSSSNDPEVDAMFDTETLYTHIRISGG